MFKDVFSSVGLPAWPARLVAEGWDIDWRQHVLPLLESGSSSSLPASINNLHNVMGFALGAAALRLGPRLLLRFFQQVVPQQDSAERDCKARSYYARTWDVQVG